MKTKLTWTITILFGAILLFVFGCNSNSDGLVLPEGNAESGKQSFMELNCNQCHEVSDIPWAGTEARRDVKVKLGGDVSMTYGELVTSVINPSHKIANKYKEEGVDAEGKSKMRVYNEYMTVQDLVDIVTFLQGEYKIMTPPNNYFHQY